MLNDNIKSLRKSKGMSQEELADKLNVVRQTVSKWEKGLSVPDSEMLIRIADVFEVSVGELLGGQSTAAKTENNEIAEQLQRINEQLAIRNRRIKLIIKIIIGIIAGIVAVNIIMAILITVARTSYETSKTEEYQMEIKIELSEQ